MTNLSCTKFNCSRSLLICIRDTCWTVFRMFENTDTLTFLELAKTPNIDLSCETREHSDNNNNFLAMHLIFAKVVYLLYIYIIYITIYYIKLYISIYIHL